jgi:hypothetical protein
MLIFSGVGYNSFQGVYDEVVIVLKGYCQLLDNMILKVRGCRYTKLMDSSYGYNRYRYHKNAIINKDISPLVGIVFRL